jgi:chromosome partitioning protein
VITNQKGGVGKTTTAISLASTLGRACRILVIDLDPQGNASTGFGIARDQRSPGTYELLGRGELADSMLRIDAVPNVDVLPAGPALAGAELEMVMGEAREHRLRLGLGARPEMLARYGQILVDCPPSLGLLTLNALVAADTVLVPLQTEFFALEGVSHLMRTIEQVRRTLNPTLSIEGILLTMYDRRNNLSELVAADVRAFFQDRVFNTVIPRNVRLSEASSHGLPIDRYDPRSPGSLAYAQLALELLERRRGHVRGAA